MATKPPTQSRDRTEPAEAPAELDLNKLVKDLGLSSVEQELVAKEARRIWKEKEWVCAKMAIKKTLVPFASTEDARSIGLSYRFIVGRDRQLENLRFEVKERAVEIKVPAKISEPTDGVKVIEPYQEDITDKIAKLLDQNPGRIKEFIEGLITKKESQAELHQ